MFDLSEQKLADLNTFAEKLGENQQVALDPKNATHRSLIQLFLEGCNKGSDRYPGMHADLKKSLARGVAAPGPPHDVTVVDAGRDSAGRATACGWHAAAGGAFLSGASTLVLNSDTNRPLAFGSATQVGGTRAAAATRTAEARPAADRMKVMTFYHSQQSPRALPQFGMVMDNIELPAIATTPTFQLTAPVTRRPAIKIGLGRVKGANPDVDYFYPEPTNYNPELLVPFVGNATLPYEIDTVGPNRTIRDLTIASKLYVQSAIAFVTLVDPAKTLTRITADSANPNVVRWDFPYDKLSEDKTKSLEFHPKGQANDTKSAFFFQFNVPIKNPIVSKYTFAICSKDWPDEPSTQCFQIPDIQYWWHCVAGGTLITLADGTKLAVESVTNEMRVATGIRGVDLGVEATSRGHHDDAGGPVSGVRQLVTETGLQLVLTSQHPVITTEGPVMAQDLEVGQPVITERGVDRVKRCDRMRYQDACFNLKLVNDDDRQRGNLPEFGSYVANGIVVGDHDCLTDHHRAIRHDLDYMRARLPEHHHTDYESALEDIAAGR